MRPVDFRLFGLAVAIYLVALVSTFFRWFFLVRAAGLPFRVLDAVKLGLGTTVFVNIRTSQHSEEWLESFAKGVATIPEIVEFYRMSGEVDYLLKIIVSDIAHYDRVYRKLIRVTSLLDVSSSFAMEQLKYTTALPLSEVAFKP